MEDDDGGFICTLLNSIISSSRQFAVILYLNADLMNKSSEIKTSIRMHYSYIYYIYFSSQHLTMCMRSLSLYMFKTIQLPDSTVSR